MSVLSVLSTIIKQFLTGNTMTETIATEQTIFQRTGIDYITKEDVQFFHPCEFDTYRKLKELNYISSFTSHANACHWRWDAKLPKNRIWKKGVYKKDHRGQVIAEVEPPIYMMEPPKTSTKLRFYIDDYERARHPKATKDQVKPLLRSIEQIDDALAAARLWFLTYQEWRSHVKQSRQNKK